MRLPLKALETFECVGRTRSFAKAASELGVTTAAVTFQIRQLEAMVGQPLLVREGGGLELTLAGSRLLAVSHRALSSLERAFLEFKPTTNRLRITATPTIADVFLHPRLRSFQQLEPDVIVEVESSPAKRDLAKEGFDAAISVGLAGANRAGSTVLFPYDVTPMASPSLVESGAVPDFTRLPLLRDPLWAEWFDASDLDRTGACEVGPHFRSQHLAARSAIAGEGVALLSPRLFMPNVLSGELVRLSAVVLDTGLNYYVRVAGGRPRTRALNGFIAWLVEETEPLRMDREPEATDPSFRG